jgi:hypothetical protein
MERGNTFSSERPAGHRLQSLQPLAQLALRESHATGFAIFSSETPKQTLSPIAAQGAPIATADLERPAEETSVAVYPLRRDGAVTGLIAFAFAKPSQISAARVRIARIVEAIEIVWRLPETAGTLVGMAQRVAELELGLADEKIASRIQGFLDDAGPVRDVAEKTARHVEIVLRDGGSSVLLAQLAAQLQAEFEDRRIIERAKDLLRNTRGLTEEQAHIELRQASRKSRRTVRKIAEDVIKETHDPEHNPDKDFTQTHASAPLSGPTRYAGRVA